MVCTDHNSVAMHDEYAVAGSTSPAWGGLLWPPYVIGQAIYIFILSFVMVALCNRADHYIFVLWFLSFFFLFFLA